MDLTMNAISEHIRQSFARQLALNSTTLARFTPPSDQLHSPACPMPAPGTTIQETVDPTGPPQGSIATEDGVNCPPGSGASGVLAGAECRSQDPYGTATGPVDLAEPSLPPPMPLLSPAMAPA